MWMNCAEIVKLGMYKPVWNNYMHASHKLSNIEIEMYDQHIDELRAKRAANFEARNIQNCMNLCTHSVLQIKQYWARNVPTVLWMNCARSLPEIVKLGMYKTVWNNYMHASHKLSNIEIEMYDQHIDELRAKRAANFEARNIQNCMNLCTHSVLQIKQYWARNVPTVLWMNYMNYMHVSHKLSNIEMYKQHMNELRAKRAVNFEAKNVQLCEIWYAREARCKMLLINVSNVDCDT